MSRPYEMPKYDLTLFNQSPTTGLVSERTDGFIDFYREGGTCRQQDTVLAGGGLGVLLVYDTGAIRNNDEICINGVTTHTITVTSVGFQQLTVINNTGTDFTPTVGQRLTPTTGRPLMYDNERGLGTPFNQLTVGAGGNVVYGFPFDAVLLDGAGTYLRILPEQTPIGGEDVIDPRKFGAACNFSTDDTEAILAALYYLNQTAPLSGPKILEMPGVSLVDTTLVLSSPNVLVRGKGIGLHGFKMTAADTLIQVSANNVRLENLFLQHGNGVADYVLDVFAAGLRFQGERLRLNEPGLGIVLRSDGEVLRNIGVEASAWARVLTIQGGATQTLGTVVDTLRGELPGDGSQFGVIVENGAKATRLTNLSLVTTDPDTQAFIPLQIQSGAGDPPEPPEDVVVSNSSLSGGNAVGAQGTKVTAGRGVRFRDVTVSKSHFGHYVTGGDDIMYESCTVVEAWEASWVLSGTGVKRLRGCTSSDASQRTDATYDHVDIQGNNVFIDDLVIGNHLRGGTFTGRHGVSYSASASVGQLRGIIPANVNGIGTGRQMINAPEATVAATVDISHNLVQRNQGTGQTLIGLMDHPGFAGQTREFSTGVELDFSGLKTYIATGAGRTFTSIIPRPSLQAQNDGAEVMFYNNGSGNMIINDVPFDIHNIGTVPVTVQPGEYVEYRFLNQTWRQLAAPAAAAQ